MARQPRSLLSPIVLTMSQEASKLVAASAASAATARAAAGGPGPAA